MKKTALSTVALLVFAMGCGVVDQLTKFRLPYSTSVTVPSVAQINLPIDLFTPDIPTNSESSFEVNDTRKDLIEQIRLDEMELKVTAPGGEDFSFLKSIEVYLSASGLEEVRIAWREDIPEDVGSNLGLETSGADLQAYIKADKFSLRVSTVTDEVITQDHVIEVKTVFFVDAKIFGV